MEREAILAHIREYMSQLFDTDAALITLDSRLSEDLDLDSIDAVDLIVKLQELIGKKIKADEFKSVRTVADVVERIHEITHRQAA